MKGFTVFYYFILDINHIFSCICPHSYKIRNCPKKSRLKNYLQLEFNEIAYSNKEDAIYTEANVFLNFSHTGMA